MDSSPPNPSIHRRGSLSLSQTLSLDWAPPPPPPADLDKIHASSSQAPGLTSFSLGSPPSRSHESAPLTKFYSRVKSIATSVMDAVGPSSETSSPTKRSFMGLVHSDRYADNSTSRDSMQSTNASSDVDPKSPAKAFSPTALLKQPGESLHSRSSSRVSSHHSMGDISGPSPLRKTSLLGSRKATNPVISPVNALRHELDAGDGYISAGASRSNSPYPSKAVASSSAAALAGNVENDGMGTGTGPIGIGRHSRTDSRDLPAALRNGSRASDAFVDVQDNDQSASDGSLSDSSDEDGVMLHSKLPGRPVQKPPKSSLSNKEHSARKSIDSSRGNPSMKRTTKPVGEHEMGALRTDHGFIPTIIESTTGLSSIPTSGRHLQPPTHEPFITTSRSESNLSRLTSNASSPNPQTSFPSLSGAHPPASVGTGPRKRTPLVSRLSTDKMSLIPSFRFGRGSANPDWSPASATGSTAKPSSTTSSAPQVEHEAAKTASGAHGGGLAGSTEAVSQALRQLKSGNLTRDFWMKDELCKECFVCGATFTAWRRKHHCRKFYGHCTKCCELTLNRPLWSNILLQVYDIDLG